MDTKPYTDRSNCARAAKKALGADAKHGVDFIINGDADGYRWTKLETAPAAEAAPAAASEPAERKPIVARLFPSEKEARRDAKLQLGRDVLGDEVKFLKTPRGEWYWKAPGTEPARADNKPTADVIPIAKGRAAKPAKAADEPDGAPAKRGRKSGNMEKLVELLKRARGASLAEIVEKIPGWQEHSARARIGSNLVKAGFKIEREKHETRGMVYKIVEEEGSTSAA